MVQKQPLGRQGGPGVFAVAAGQDGRHRVGVHPACPHFTEGAGQNPDHIVQISVRRHQDADGLSLPCHLAVGDGADGVPVGRRRTVGRAQGQKIVFPHKVGCRLLHPAFLQAARHPAVIPLLKGGVDGAVVDPVEIGLGVGGIPGVKAVRHQPGLQHPDVPGQFGIEGQGQLGGGNPQLGLKAEGKAQGMDPGVGAAAALDVGAKADHRLQSVLEGGGHALPVGLHLKAAVVGAVKGQCQQPGHRPRLLSQ